MFAARIDRHKPLIILSGVLFVALGTRAAQSESPGLRGQTKLASVQEMIDSLTDVWGDAAMRQPDGASYEFFKDLLPPLRWVNTEFRYYPIVLSALRAPQKSRLVSNGSAVNAKANKPPMWYEQGVPVKFYVGDFGGGIWARISRDWIRLLTSTDICRLSRSATESGGAVYLEQSFAPVDEMSAAHGVAMVRFSIGKDGAKGGRVEARIDSDDTLRVQNGDCARWKRANSCGIWTWMAVGGRSEGAGRRDQGGYYC